MAPKRATRSTPVTTTPAPTATTTTSVTNAQLQAMIDQGVTAALAARDANRNGDDSHTSGTGGRRTERVARECSNIGLEFVHVFFLTVRHDVAYAMTWADLRQKMTDKYCPRNEIKKLEAELWNLKVKGTDVIGYNQRFQELALLCVRMFSEEFDKIERTSAPLQKTGLENKRKFENTSRNNLQETNLSTNTRDRYTGSALYYAGIGDENRTKDDGTFIVGNDKASTIECCAVLDMQDKIADSNCRVWVHGDGTAPETLVGCIALRGWKTMSEIEPIKDVPIFQDFPEVFLEDCLGLPPRVETSGNFKSRRFVYNLVLHLYSTALACRGLTKVVEVAPYPGLRDVRNKRFLIALLRCFKEGVGALVNEMRKRLRAVVFAVAKEFGFEAIQPLEISRWLDDCFSVDGEISIVRFRYVTREKGNIVVDALKLRIRQKVCKEKVEKQLGRMENLSYGLHGQELVYHVMCDVWK
ncbi:reverse transcriptase domain-containing protein [Tanacetum coccineum]